jgi:hypothetical protein
LNKSKNLFNIFIISLQYQNLGAFLALRAKNRAFRFNLLATPKGFPLQSRMQGRAANLRMQIRDQPLARPRGFQDTE